MCTKPRTLKPLISLLIDTLFHKILVFLLMVYNEKCICGILEITHIVWMIIFCVVHKYWTKIFLKFNLLWRSTFTKKWVKRKFTLYLITHMKANLILHRRGFVIFLNNSEIYPLQEPKF